MRGLAYCQTLVSLILPQIALNLIAKRLYPHPGNWKLPLIRYFFQVRYSAIRYPKTIAKLLAE